MRRLSCTLIGLLALGATLTAQPYSTPPTLQAYLATGLTLPYTIGTVYNGGFAQTIQPGNVTLTDNMTNCRAPQYAACNLVYWNGSSTALSITTSPTVAFSSGTAIIGFVTTSGGAIVNIVSFAQASQGSGNLVPAGTPTTSGLRLPICNAIINQGCQGAVKSLNGY